MALSWYLYAGDNPANTVQHLNLVLAQGLPCDVE